MLQFRMQYGWLWAWACTLGTATAGELDHRLAVQHALWSARTEMHKGYLLFFSDMYVQKENGSFTQSSGQTFMSVPAWTYSHYDTSVAHSMQAFYSSAQFRYRWVLNYVSPSSHWLLSIGHDNGVQTPKLDISPAVFFGMAKAVDLHKNHYLQLSWGQWFGGKVTQRPCWDVYDRAYWCPQLTAWSDRPGLALPSLQYYELKYQWVFD
jgi:hypothetical protein